MKPILGVMHREDTLATFGLEIEKEHYTNPVANMALSIPCKKIRSLSKEEVCR